MKSFFPSGIIRNTPDNATVDGALLEAVNTRNKDGARRQVGEKVRLEDNLSNLPENSFVYFHHQSGLYLCVVNRSGSYTVESWSADASGGTQGSFSLSIDRDAKISGIGNYAYVYSETSSYVIFWNNTDYVYIPELPGIKFAVGTQSPTTRDVYVLTADLTTDQEKYSAVIGQFYKVVAEAMEDGYFHGHMVFRYAYKMFDGSYVMHSDIFYARGGYCYNGSSVNALRVNVSDVWLGDDAATIKQNFDAVYFDKLRFFCDTSSVVNDLKTYIDSGLIKGIGVFASQVLPGYSVTENYDDLIPYSGGTFFPIVYDIETGVSDQQSLFLIKTISTSSLSSGVAFDFTVDSLRDISLNEGMQPDNFTHHRMSPDVVFPYNSKLHIANIQTKLGLVANYFHQYFSATYPTVIPDSDIAGIVLDGFVNQVSQPTDFKYFATIELATSSGIKKKTVELTDGFYDDGSTVSIIFNPLFIVPDLRGKSITFWVQWEGDNSCKKISSHDLVASAFSNYSYISEQRYYPGPGTDIILKNFSVPVPQNWTEYSLLPDGYTFESFDDSVTDSNRVQVSRMNNPFVWPADNSYRFGGEDNTVLGLITAQEPMTETVFGQYPISVFTQSGIYALEQGSDSVLYSRVVEVNKEILSNPAGLLGVTGGVLFVAKDGIKLLQGRSVVNISIPVRGEYSNPVLSDMYLVDVLGDSKICDVVLSDSFTDYIQDAVMYHSDTFNELIVSNKGKEYSYVYSFESQSWHTLSSEVFSQFVNRKGYRSGYFYDIETEGDPKPYYLQTRPFFLEDGGYKKIEQLMVRRTNTVNQNEFDAVLLYGSNDCVSWVAVGKSLTGENLTPILKNIPGHYRYFILCFAGKGSNLSIVSVDVNFNSRYNNKIR